MSEIKYAISQVFRGIRIAGCSFLLGSAFVVGCGILKRGGRFHMEIKSRNMELVLEPAAIEAEAKRND